MMSFKSRSAAVALASFIALTACTALTPSASHAARRKSKSLPIASRLKRKATTSRSLTMPKVVGRLGVVSQDESPIYSSPGQKPLYSLVGRETYLVLVGQRDDYYAVLMADGRYGWIKKPRVSLLNYDVVNGKTGDPGTDFGNKVVQDSFKYLGLPYIWGGYSTSGTDCSGFVKAVFAQNGVSLPRVARDQARVGQEVSPSDLRPGDRVYFSFKGRYIDHTGLYIGNGYFIHNSTNNKRVAVDLLTSRTYWRKLVSCRR